MKSILGFFLILIILFTSCLAKAGEESEFSLCPLCNRDGMLTCPEGFNPACKGGLSYGEPTCLFYGKKYVPGCLKFVGYKMIDLDFNLLNLPAGSMVEVIGGGETFELNRESIGCRIND